MVLYIKYPEPRKSLTYYIRPFSFDIWICNLLLITFGGFLCVAMKSLKNLILKYREHFNVFQYFLLPYEYFLNQG